VRRTDEKASIAEFLQSHGLVKSGSRVLDVGGGDGQIARALKGIGASVLVVEPERKFFQPLRIEGFEVMPTSWEKASIGSKFDLVLASHVVTYFPDHRIIQLIGKMLARVRRGGALVIITVDQNRGSWREIHELFYRLNSIGKRKTSDHLLRSNLRAAMRRYGIRTTVSAPSVNRMLDLLQFDFADYPNAWSRSKSVLRRYLEERKTGSSVSLDVVHQVLVCRV
jgi:SAM-dependent methyltransferase